MTNLIDSIREEDKPYVQLVGADGNAFSILARVRNAWLDRPDIVEEYTARAKSGDYNNLLRVTMEYIREGNEYEDEEDVKY